MIDSFEIKSAALTGATGAIGRALINELLKNGIRVLVFARESERARELERLGITVVYTDLSELENIHLSEQYDAFFHLGWNGTRERTGLTSSCRKRTLNIRFPQCGLQKGLGANPSSA
jgi:NAD dependent epimerase/dehydratase family enzyme